jgi:hypothetical protein
VLNIRDVTLSLTRDEVNSGKGSDKMEELG